MQSKEDSQIPGGEIDDKISMSTEMYNFYKYLLNVYKEQAYSRHCEGHKRESIGETFINMPVV